MHSRNELWYPQNFSIFKKKKINHFCVLKLNYVRTKRFGRLAQRQALDANSIGAGAAAKHWLSLI